MLGGDEAGSRADQKRGDSVFQRRLCWDFLVAASHETRAHAEDNTVVSEMSRMEGTRKASR
jgi:hypothetical protein